ncbi:MAG: 3-oxoacyl-ACP synthase [Winogradskyella sp.]
MNIKEELYNKCYEALQLRLSIITRNIADLENALQSETKSSAGDKHETGRAMVQLEREKAGKQLAELQKSMGLLQKIEYSSRYKSVALGSIVYTSEHNYFISISEGELKLGDNVFYAISPQSPIAKLLLGKTEGDAIIFRNSNFVISKVI